MEYIGGIVERKMADRQASVKEAGEAEPQKEKGGKGGEKKNKGGKKGRKRSKDSSSDEEGGEAQTITEAIINPSEIQRMIDLGLGRGIDATISCPWLNKTSFQVREVTQDNLIGTDEGGILKGYVTEVASAQSFQTDMSASVPVSQQVSIGVDSELSRSYSCNRKAVGKKVMTRTISFQTDFTDLTARKASFEEREEEEEGMDGGEGTMEEVPEAEPKKKPLKRARSRQQSMGSGRSVSFARETGAEIEPSSLTFEERLCKWIVTQMIIDGKFTDKIYEEANPVETIITLLNEDRKSVAPDIRENCKQFVNYFHVTHYVSAIELGASKYRVMSDEEYHTQVSVSGNVGVEQMASVAVSQKAQWSSRNRQSEVTKIGRFSGNGKVQRGTSEEAVVGVKFQPISSLIRIKKLQKILQNQIQNYIDSSEENSKIGPFYIASDSERLFLTVNDQFQVQATRNESEAKKFFIIPNEDGLTPFEFSIVYKPEPVYKRIKSVPRYLCATVDAWGKSPGPLPLKLNAKETKSRLTLHSRMSRYYHPVDITPWVSGREIFYINCKHRSVKGDSYLCVKPREGATDPNKEYVMACVRSIKSHDEANETYMLFRLLKPGKLRAIENEKNETGQEEDIEPPAEAQADEITNKGPQKQSKEERQKQRARKQQGGGGGGGRGGGGAGGGGGGGKKGKEHTEKRQLLKQASQESNSGPEASIIPEASTESSRFTENHSDD